MTPIYAAPQEADHAFQKDRHIRYWLRCAKTFLPNQYTPNDANRMTLGFFVVAALDLLGVLRTRVTLEERQGWIDWIYGCQVPEGGFRGFTGTELGELRNAANCHWDPANLPATFFALATLTILGDDLKRASKAKCLEWLPTLQRDNGSFGELLGKDGQIEGGNDLRFCCCATGILYILGANRHEDYTSKANLIDTDMMVQYIESCQTYEGGFSEGPLAEAHSGLTYCAVGALSFLRRMGDEEIPHSVGPFHSLSEDCARYMLQRQTTWLEECDTDEDEDEGVLLAPSRETETLQVIQSDENKENPQSLRSFAPDSKTHTPPHEVLPVAGVEESSIIGGFNGRTNKIADTCYCFWNTGALSILGFDHLVNASGLRRYLLGKVQHVVGGFGKGVGEPPDILHSYLGLAALSLLDEPDLRGLDATLCISKDAAQNLQRKVWKTS